MLITSIEATLFCHNKILLKNILKNLWGFDGVVISDWGGTHRQMNPFLMV